MPELRGGYPCPIFKFFVVTREVIPEKMPPILDSINFFGVLTLLGHCVFFFMSHTKKTLSQKTVQNPFFNRNTWDGKTCLDEKNLPFRNSTYFSSSWCPESPPKISKSAHYGILRKGLFRFFCLLRTIFFIFGPFLGRFFGVGQIVWSVDIMGVITDKF